MLTDKVPDRGRELPPQKAPPKDPLSHRGEHDRRPFRPKTWGPILPRGTPAKKPEMRLDCSVTLKDGTWQATFEGECGRPYKYTIKMDGRQVEDVVLFKGTTDLGEKDGGVYDWIGRATDTEFVGFYTSKKYTGTFKLTKKK
jgi:hypothetical protein